VELKSPGYKMVEIVWTSASQGSPQQTAATNSRHADGAVALVGPWLSGTLQTKVFALGWSGLYWLTKREMRLG